VLTSFFSFNGRIGRGMWWLTGVLQALLIIGAGVYIVNVDAAANPRTGWQGPVFFGIIILIAWIGICGNIKRYHDRGKSGFWVFIGLVPIIGAIWMFIELGMLPGDEGANDFGPAPGSTADTQNYGRRAEDKPSKLSHLDDSYFADYAKKLAEQSQQAATTTGVGSPSATFGRRKTDVL
jgi:uncharacterized membrane protein YhaH (DUF805 family)